MQHTYAEPSTGSPLVPFYPPLLANYQFPFENTMTLSFDSSEVFFFWVVIEPPPPSFSFSPLFLCLFLKVFNLSSKTGGVVVERQNESLWHCKFASLTSGSPSLRAGLVTGSRMSPQIKRRREVHGRARTRIGVHHPESVCNA